MLENLINFFFQNIFFFIILLFGLSQLFLRRTNQQQETKRTEQGPLPPVSKPFFEEWLEPDVQPSSKTNKREANQSEAQTFDNIGSESVQFEETNTTGLDTEWMPEINNDMIRDEGEKKQELNELRFPLVPRYRPVHEDVVKGVIWSEILGPPRARKKHIDRY